jgi:curved DNA-binding protein CbpA
MAGPEGIDAYAVLGIGPTASSDEIRDAFRRAVRNLHPDHHPGGRADHTGLTAVADAWELLADPDRRAAHDRARAPVAARAPGLVAAPMRSLQLLFSTAVVVTVAVLVIFTIIALSQSG